jgi:hypothetical protein
MADVFGGMTVVVPKMPTFIQEMWNHSKESVNEALGMHDLPLDTKNKEHYTWMNSATTPEELINNAASIKNTFLHVMETCCRESGAKLFTGPDHKYLLKSVQSIKAKVNKYSKAGGDKTHVLQKINDPIRATIIAKNIPQLKQAIHKFKTEMESISGTKFVFSNKWNMEYTNGYVGVHSNFMMEHVTKEGSIKTVRGEVQFHLQQIVDETFTSANAISHTLYEQGRQDELPAITLFREQAMKTLFTGAILNIPIPEKNPKNTKEDL